MVSEIEPNLEEKVEEPILLDYANVNKEMRWYNPFRYSGALAGIGYGLVWPTLVLSYVGIPGFSNLYDKFLPHESLQDNFIYYAFRVPFELVEDDKGMLVGYFIALTLIGHGLQKTGSFIRKSLKKKIKG